MLHTIAFETLTMASRNLNSLRRFRVNCILNHTEKISVQIQNENYALQTVRQSKDLLHLLKLRSTIEGRSNDLKFSIPSFTFTDDFDAIAEHVLIRNLRTNTIVGGFRLLSSSFTDRFSSDVKFDLNELKKVPVKILELSKLFILPEHKHQDLLTLSTRFLSEYALKSSDDILICSQSINSGSSRSAALAFQYFKSLNLLKNHFPSVPKTPFQVPNLDHWIKHFETVLSKNEQHESLSLLSTTFKESLTIGAAIAGFPAQDKLTNRIDFLTILDKEDLNRTLWKKSYSSLEFPFGYSYS